jgi:hypothetical protein
VTGTVLVAAMKENGVNIWGGSTCKERRHPERFRPVIHRRGWAVAPK